MIHAPDVFEFEIWDSEANRGCGAWVAIVPLMDPSFDPGVPVRYAGTNRLWIPEGAQ